MPWSSWTKAYRRKRVVDCLTCRVEPGRVTGFVGPNGAGKFALSRADEVLELVGLTEVAARRAGTLSLGMAQRLALATVLLGDPAVLILDEPMNGLDPAGIVWLRTLLRSLAREGRTVLVSSHLMNEMAVTADHVLIIGRGRPMAYLTWTDSSRPGSCSGAVRARSPLR